MSKTCLYTNYGNIELTSDEWRQLTEVFTDVAKLFHPDGDERRVRGLKLSDPLYQLTIVPNFNSMTIPAIQCTAIANRLRVYLPLAVEMGLLAWHGERLITALEFHAKKDIPVTFK